MSESKLNRITEHVYWLSPDESTDRPILGAVVGQHSTLMIDAGNSPAHAQLFLDGLTKAGIALPQFLVLTHWHWDHVFGTAALNQPTFAHHETKRLVREMAGFDWSDEALDQRVAQGVEIEFCRDMIKAELPDRTNLKIVPPNIGFSDHVALDLGGITCHLIHIGGDHAADSTIVYVPEEKVLFLGDCLYADLYSGPHSYTPQKLFPLIQQLHQYDAEFYLLAHDPEAMSKMQMLAYTTLLRTIGQQVEALGDSREKILLNLPETLGEALNEEQIWLVDAFLAGVRKTNAQVHT